MFDLPSLEGVEEVVISKEVVEGAARPLYIYADRVDRTSDASASYHKALHGLQNADPPTADAARGRQEDQAAGA
jgi:hypothetical protein